MIRSCKIVLRSHESPTFGEKESDWFVEISVPYKTSNSKTSDRILYTLFHSHNRYLLITVRLHTVLYNTPSIAAGGKHVRAENVNGF
jgi:hypothetical protein